MLRNSFFKAKVLFMTLAVIPFVVNCGSGSDSDNKTVPVSITFNLPTATMKSGKVLSAPSPPIVKSITITISATDMATITDTFNVGTGTVVTRSYSISPGTERTFMASAYDGTSASGFLLYQGTSIDDLVAGTSATIIITMTEAPYTGKYVDINRGFDNPTSGTPISPYKTITYAIGQSAGNEPINVAEGFYNISTGEFFPLQLKTGTELNCYGANHTTVIDLKNNYVRGFLGYSGASVVGCQIINSLYTAIDDNGISITIDNNLIRDNCSGIYASGNSLITNNIIENNTNAFDCNQSGIYSNTFLVPNTPTISGNTIINNPIGIYITNSIPAINNNIISCNSSSDIENWTASPIDAKNNQWDHAPPFVSITTVCGAGEDICDVSGSFVNYSGYSLAPLPCP